MISIIGFFNDLAAVWWPLVLSITWQSTLLACLLLGVVLLGRRWPSPLRYGLVLVALLKFVVPPTSILPIGLYSWLDPGIPLLVGATDSSVPEPMIPLRVPAAAAVPAGQPELVARQPGLSWQAGLLLVYLFGAAVALAWVFRQLRGLYRLAAAAQEITGEQELHLLGRLCQELRLRRVPRLLVSAGCPAPAAFGLRRPTVIISARMHREMSPEHLRVVLAHELAHHRRGDLWINWLQIVLAIVWWFNPILHLLSRTVRSVREDCCDDLLLAAGVTSSRRYCDALLHTADVLTCSSSYRHALGFADRLHPLGRRLTRIMDASLPRPLQLSRIAMVVLLLVAGLLLPGGPVIGSEQLERLRGEERLVQQQLGALTLLELRRSWPAYVLHQVDSLPPDSLQVDKLQVSEDAVTISGRAGGTAAVAACLSTLDTAALLEPQLQSLRREQEGMYHFVIELTPSFLQAGSDAAPEAGEQAQRDAIGQHRRRRDEALARLPEQQAAGEVLRQIKSCLEQPETRLLLFKPSAIRTAGLYDEWPLLVELESTAEAVQRTIAALSRITAPLIVDRLQIEENPEAAEQPLTASFSLFVVLRGKDDRSMTPPATSPSDRSEKQLLQDLSTMRRAMGEAP